MSKPQEESTYDLWLKGYKSAPLTPEDAHRVLQLQSSLEQMRSLVVDYLLLRASCSTDKVEKRGWWILYGLLAFVERMHHFPRKEELFPYITEMLHTGVPKLPDYFDLDCQSLLEVAQQMRIQKEQIRRTTIEFLAKSGGNQDEENYKFE